MSCFLWIIQIKFVMKTQSLINRLEYELYVRILELVFKNQQNKYEMNGKKPQIYSLLIYLLLISSFPIFQFSYFQKTLLRCLCIQKILATLN